MFAVFGIATIVAMVFGTGWVANDVAHEGFEVGPVAVAPLLSGE